MLLIEGSESGEAIEATDDCESSLQSRMDISHYLEGFAFEWNASKAQSNFEKHGVTFEEAAEVFLDPFHVVGDASANQEAREFVLGYSIAERLLLVVHLDRDATIRIISARAAIRSERQLYEQYR